MSAVGQVLARKGGIIGRLLSRQDSRLDVADPAWVSFIVLSLNCASRGSSAFMTDNRGAKPPPAG